MKKPILIIAMALSLQLIAQETHEKFYAGIIAQNGTIVVPQDRFISNEKYNPRQFHIGISFGCEIPITQKISNNISLDFFAPITTDSIFSFAEISYQRALYKTYGFAFEYAYNYRFFNWLRVGTGFRIELRNSLFYQDNWSFSGWSQEKYTESAGAASIPANVFIDFNWRDHIITWKSSFNLIIDGDYYTQTGVYFRF